MNPIIEIDSDGRLVDPTVQGQLRSSMADARRLILFSHGWMASEADLQNHLAAIESGLLPLLDGQKTQLIGVHWPSLKYSCELADVVATFYPCANLALTVGRNGVRDLLETALESADGPLEIIPIGHSFGCRVVSEAVVSIRDGVQNAAFRMVLLAAAFASSWMEPGEPFGRLILMPAKILATTSDGDMVLKIAYPIAIPGSVALGSGGPTEITQLAFGKRFQTLNILPWQEAQQAVSIDRHSQWNLPQLWHAIADFIQSKDSPP